MIILDTIHEVIQKTLLEKMRMAGKSKTKISEPMSKDDLGGGNTDLSYLSARTIWARMISLQVPNTKKENDVEHALRKLGGEGIKYPPTTEPIVISGGEEITAKLPSTIQDLGTPRSIGGKLRGDSFAIDKNGNYTNTDAVYDRNNYYRPMAGLKNINTEIKGDTKALKQITVNWTCWDFQTLTKLTPHFLHPGATVALEFGWMWPGHKPSEKVYRNWTEINPNELQNITDAVIEEGRGNQEMLYGIVSNFNWTGRDDGGFDCTTTLVSPASNIFGESVGDTEKAETFEFTDAQKNQIRAQRSFWKWRSWERSSFNKANDKNKTVVSAEDTIDDKTIVNVPPRVFFDGIRDELLRMSGTINTLGGNTKYHHTVLTELHDKDIDGQDDRFLGPYITYGWFEDNILNRFVSRINKTNQLVNYVRSVNAYKPKKYANTYQSVKIRNDSANLLTMNAQEVIIPGQFPFDLDFDEVEKEKTGKKRKTEKGGESKHREAMSKLARRIAELPNFSTQRDTDVKKRTPSSEMLSQLNDKKRGASAGFDNDISEFDTLKKNSQKRIAKLNNEKSDDKREFGYLRNLLINIKIVEEEFVKANTLEDGLQSLLDRMSAACGNVWDFKIQTNDDGFSLSVQEENSNIEPVRSLLRNPSADINTGLPKEGYNHDGLLVFPTWRTNSIVHTQQMTSKIPSGMQTAVVYGRNKSEVEGLTKDTNQDKKGVKLGEIFDIKGKEATEDNSFTHLERILGNSHWDTNGFGNNIQTRHGATNNNHNNLGLVGEPLLDDTEHRTDIHTSNMLKNWTQDQIMKVLDDGIEYDKDIKPEDGYSVNADTKKEYRYLYTKLGLMRKNYKAANLYFINNAPDSI